MDIRPKMVDGEPRCSGKDCPRYGYGTSSDPNDATCFHHDHPCVPGLRRTIERLRTIVLSEGADPDVYIPGGLTKPELRAALAKSEQEREDLTAENERVKKSCNDEYQRYMAQKDISEKEAEQIAVLRTNLEVAEDLWSRAFRDLKNKLELLEKHNNAQSVVLAGAVQALGGAPVMAREPVVWFAEQMEKKLAEHDDSDSYGGCSDDWLLKRLREEAQELEDVLPGGKVPMSKTRSEEIISEAADVANFAMMIADNARRS